MLHITTDQLIYEAITVILQVKELSKVTRLKNGCFAVGYDGKGTIISGKRVTAVLNERREYLHKKACIRKLVANSRSVHFVSVYSESAYTDKGYRVTLNSCSCPFKKAGNPVCKHMIAYARFTGIYSLSQYLKVAA